MSIDGGCKSEEKKEEEEEEEKEEEEEEEEETHAVELTQSTDSQKVARSLVTEDRSKLGHINEDVSVIICVVVADVVVVVVVVDQRIISQLVRRHRDDRFSSRLTTVVMTFIRIAILVTPSGRR